MTVDDARPEGQQWDVTIRRHVRVVSALVRREMSAYGGESRLGYMWAIIEPILHLLGYMVIFEYILKRNSSLGGSLPLFLLTGIVPYFLFSKMAVYVSSAVRSNRSLLNLPPVKPFDVVVARVVLESTTYLFVGFIMFVGLYLGGIASAIPYDPMAVMQACVLSICLGLGVGMINLVITSFFHNWMTIYGLFSFPLWFFSGLWFLPEQVPQPFREYVLYNPLTHVVMWFRTGFYRDFKAVYLDPSYVVGVSVLLVVIGSALMRVTRRKLLEPL